MFVEWVYFSCLPCQLFPLLLRLNLHFMGLSIISLCNLSFHVYFLDIVFSAKKHNKKDGFSWLPNEHVSSKDIPKSAGNSPSSPAFSASSGMQIVREALQWIKNKNLCSFGKYFVNIWSCCVIRVFQMIGLGWVMMGGGVALPLDSVLSNFLYPGIFFLFFLKLISS